ncbi:MAG TPA: hypothetical protein VKV15_00925 [Bryobacteraceae bacterium]|nr:hypothetical protein [Bryobacteraceae bacterium]
MFVVLGVCFEYGPKFIVFLQTLTFEAFRDLIGGLMIALGVAGELLFASLAANKRDRLRDRNIMRVADLNWKAEQESLARAEVEKTLAGTTEATERLRKENLQLEKAFSRRYFMHQDKAAERLLQFGPVEVLIEYLQDGECRSTAGMIAYTLNMAKWRFSAFRAVPYDSPFFDGVIVHGLIREVNDAGIVPEHIERGSRAAEALIRELNKTDIKAHGHAADPNASPGVVVIRVGMNPGPVKMDLSPGYHGNQLYRFSN